MIKIKPTRGLKVGDVLTLGPALQKKLKTKTLTVIHAVTSNDKSIPVTKRGRPPTGKAMTNAQRQAKFKALKKRMDVETAAVVNRGYNG